MSAAAQCTRRKEARGAFDGSARLFAACWRELLWFERETGESFDAAQVADFLHDAASRRVNNPRSSFWLYGE